MLNVTFFILVNTHPPPTKNSFKVLYNICILPQCDGYVGFDNTKNGLGAVPMRFSRLVYTGMLLAKISIVVNIGGVTGCYDT